MVSNQQFCLKWNNHRNTVIYEFGSLLRKNSFVDCTIGADGRYIEVHKMILSSCSPYFQNILSDHSEKHPVILLKDVSFKELNCVIDYIYNGEVNIFENELPSFLKIAQSLKIKGLTEDLSPFDSNSETKPTRNSEELNGDSHPLKKGITPCSLSPNLDNVSVLSSRKRETASNVKSLMSLRAHFMPETDEKVLASSSKKDPLKVSAESYACQEPVENNLDLEEETLEADIKHEEDNSSYERPSNLADNADPLNGEAESSVTGIGIKLNERIISNVASSAENDTYDGSLNMVLKTESNHCPVISTEEFVATNQPSGNVSKVKNNSKKSSKSSNVDESTTKRHSSKQSKYQTKAYPTTMSNQLQLHPILKPAVGFSICPLNQQSGDIKLTSLVKPIEIQNVQSIEEPNNVQRSGNLLLLNSSSRIMFVKSDEICMQQVKPSISLKTLKKTSSPVKKKLSATRTTTKYRKIAPLPTKGESSGPT